MAKRCLVVTYYFPPNGGGGVQRIVKLIKYLSRNDWQFSVVTSALSLNNIPQDNNLIRDVPTDVKVNRVSNSINSKGKSIWDSLLLSFKSTFLVRWINAFLFIPDIHTRWSLAVYDRIQLLMKSGNFDLILVSSPPYSLAVLAAKLIENVSIPVVFDMRDPWTTNPYKIHPTQWHFKRDRLLEFDAIKRIKYGTSAYASLIQFYQKNIPDFKTENWRYIPNGFDEDDFAALSPVDIDSQKLNIAFSGTFYSHINNPLVLFKAIASLQAYMRDKIIFHHIGTSNISLSKLAKKYNISACVREWGYHPHQDCLNILSSMDVYCFILDSANPNAVNTIGGKVYEYLRLRKPILALVPENGDAAHLINNLKAGIVIDSNNQHAIKKLLISWIEKKPVINSNPDITEFKRALLAQKFSKFFDQILL